MQPDETYQEFVQHLKNFPKNQHPSEQSVGVCWYVLYWAFFLIVLLIPLAYLFLIILQLALFNLIMLVVMVVWWGKFFRISRAVIKRCIDNSRTKYYRKFIKTLKELHAVHENSIEI